MKKSNFEKINEKQFQQLSTFNMLHVLGGATTGSGSIVTGRTPNKKDGKIVSYTVSHMSWKSDEIDGRDICYDGVSHWETQEKV